MKYIIIALLFCNSLNAQKNYLNSDGTISSEYYRDLYLAAFKEHETEDNKYDMEDRYFIIISKKECESPVSNEKNQNTALAACLTQLHTRIRALQRGGFKDFEKAEFKGMIFKTNYVCSYETRRYHFKFSLEELKNFPEYMDIYELYQYIVVKNQSSNIIYIKNSK